MFNDAFCGGCKVRLDGVEGVATFVKVVYEKGGDLDKVFAVGVLSPVKNCCTKDEAFET